MAAVAPAVDHPDLNELQRVIAAAMDADFYRAVYTDVPADIAPLWHYAAQGWREARDPAPWFSVETYLAANPDVAEAGLEPLFHFLTRGRHEGREVAPSRHATDYLDAVGWAPRAWTVEAFAVASTPQLRRRQPRAPTAGAAPLISDAEARAAAAEAFDRDFYLTANPDVADADIDPLDHFMSAGWTEGRDPSPGFSVRDYLDAYPDVAASGLNPFVHYLLAGRHEGRQPKHDLGYQFDVIARLRTIETRVADAQAYAAKLSVQQAADLTQRLGKLTDLHITFSHDDYVAHAGGLQSCIRRESARFADFGIDHLHIHPAAAWFVIRDDEPGLFGVMLNGRHLGYFAPDAVLEGVTAALAPKGPKTRRRTFAIHSLLGHRVDEVLALLAAAGLREGWFWLHDFSSLCAGFHLQRNDVEDCAAPPPGSPACSVCLYDPYRGRHLDAHADLFAALSLTVVAPSQATLDFWRARTGLEPRESLVLPHARLVARGPAPKPPKGRPFRFAYLGMPTALKGWPLFRALAERMAGDPRYEFLQLGGRPDPAATNVAFHPVTVTVEQPRAMQETLEALEVDATLIWPNCRETFSFTAYESAAAGAAVVTGPYTGNVAAFVGEPGRGREFADDAALFEAFASGAILDLGRAARRAKLFDLAYSGLSGDLLAEAVA